ncbi:MAG TPA: hypothetical protein VGA66_01790 [Mycobacterium sp.]|jgi:hypothetical protein
MVAKCMLGTGVGLVAVVLLFTGGCGDDDSGPQYAVIEGRALDIDADDKVSMEYVNKQGVTVEGTAEVDDNAEIWINGKQAKIEDVKKGDRVRAAVRIEGHDLNKRFIATKIEVERAAFEATSQPAATQPASGENVAG